MNVAMAKSNYPAGIPDFQIIWGGSSEARLSFLFFNVSFGDSLDFP